MDDGLNSELKRYLADIGRRGGSATSEKKASAVRENGTKGGRPRKDGLPPGSQPLETVLGWIKDSGCSERQKRDLDLHVHKHAFYRKEKGHLFGFVPRNAVIELKTILQPHRGIVPPEPS